MCSGTPHDCTSYGGIKNEKKAWRKKIRVTPYIYVYTLMYWAYIQAYTFDFVYKFCHAFNLLFIVYKCTDASPKHSTLYFGAKNDKKICANHKYLQPLIILIHTRTYSYILVHTCTYSYILSYNTVYFESGWIRLAMTYCRCCTLVQRIAHSILHFCGLFDGQASQAGLAAPKLPQPRVDLIISGLGYT